MAQCATQTVCSALGEELLHTRSLENSEINKTELFYIVQGAGGKYIPKVNSSYKIYPLCVSLRVYMCNSLVRGQLDRPLNYSNTACLNVPNKEGLYSQTWKGINESLDLPLPTSHLCEKLIRYAEGNATTILKAH